MTEYQNQATYALLAIVGLLIVVPLAYTTDIFAYTLLPKRLAFSIFAAIAALGWLTTSARDCWTIPFQTPAIGLSVLCLFALISLVNATNLWVAGSELVFLLTLVGLFFVGQRATDRDTKIWTLTILVTGAAVSIVGILQYHDLAFTHIPSNGQPSATFGYRNFAAMYLVAVLPIALFAFLYTNSRPTAALSFITGLLAALFLLYTRTRGAWLGAFVGTLGAFILLVARRTTRAEVTDTIRKTGQFKPVAAGLALLALLYLGPMAPRFTDTGLQRFDEKKADLQSTMTSALAPSGDRGRLAMWQRSLPLIWDHLLTGVGPGHWEFAYPRYDGGAMIRPDSAPKRPHNDFIWIASEHGLPGLVGYLIFLAAVLIYAIRSTASGPAGRREVTYAAIAILIGVSIHACFSFPKEQPQIASVFFLFAGVAVRGQQGRSLPEIPVAAALLVLGAVGTYINWQQLNFDRHFLRAMLAEDSGRWQDMEREAAAGLELGTFRSQMYVILGRAHEKQGQLDRAGHAYAKALKIFPNSWHAHNGSGVVRKRLGDHPGAMVHYERALKIYPDAPSVRTNLGALYRAMGNQDRAETQFRRVLQSAPLNEGANNNLGNILKARGELDSAEVYYRRVLDRNPGFTPANQNLGDLLTRRREYREAIRHYHAALEAHPHNALTMWSLGSAYESLGDLGEAETYYRQAIEANPNFPRSYFSLATMLFGVHRWQETIDLFETFLTMWKGDPKFRTFAEGRIKASRDWIQRIEKK